MAARRNIEIYRGDTYTHEVRLKNSSNNAINISSMSFSASIKSSAQATSNIAVFDVAITDAANGIMTFSLTAANTANLVPGTYIYDLEQTNATVVTTLLRGNVVVKSDVT